MLTNFCKANQRSLAALLCFTIIFLIMANYYLSTITDDNNTASLFNSSLALTNSETRGIIHEEGLNATKLILLWSSLYSSWNFLKSGKITFMDSHCAEQRCEVTQDRRRLADSDAIVFHSKTMSLLDIPKYRSPHQKWIFFSMEPPPYSYFLALRFTVGMFNWTMSYRLDSDVIIPYGVVRRSSKKVKRFSRDNLLQKWKQKRKMAVALISHCKTSGNREEYIKELSKHMDIDVYGQCGQAVCSGKTTDCLENFSKRYHFLLAFENSICADYVTEKLYSSLKHDLIPVVFGGGSYTVITPGFLFPNAMDYDSPVSLASHLYDISKNFTIFESYVKWRVGQDVSAVTDHCELCKKLHSNSFQEKTVYSDITDWWVNKSHCRTWNKHQLYMEDH